MRKLMIAVCISLFCAVQANAQAKSWYTDMGAASQVAMAEKKPLLMFFTGSDWCGWCKRLQSEVFKTSEFKEWAEDHVILVELDFPRRKKLDKTTQIQNYQLQQLFKVRGYPTVVFANPEDKGDNKMNLNHLGSTGYVRGGVGEWLNAAKSIVK